MGSAIESSVEDTIAGIVIQASKLATRQIRRVLSTNLVAASKAEAPVLTVAHSFTIVSEQMKNHSSTTFKEGKVAGTCFGAEAGT